LPTKRIALGRSLGPMTTKATTTTSSNSVGATSNIYKQSGRRWNSAVFGFRGRSRRRGQIGRALAFDLFRRGRRRFVLGHALLEAFDALGDIAHHVRKAALAEQQQDE